MDDELWAYIAERSARREITPNAWIVRMVRMVKDGRLVEVKPEPPPLPPVKAGKLRRAA